MTVVSYFTRYPHNLFLVDSLGAGVTTFSLFVVWGKVFPYSGMPVGILNGLSLVGLLFCIYSAVCFLLLKNNWTPFLRLIAIANLAYALSAAVLVSMFFDQLSVLGTTYFLFEIMILFVLVGVELRVAARLVK